jgi:hypothetical protein
MKRIIKCDCEQQTWYDDKSTVAMVDAWRTLQIKCKCGESNVD